jgi:RNA polymerase sigma-70 factor (ECF subfamily)
VLKQDEGCHAVSEETLMEQLKGGSMDALAALFDRYRRLVLTVATRILRDSAEAEDLTQDVFIEIHRKARLYDPSKGSVKTWVLQYAYHRSFNRQKYVSLRRSYSGSFLEIALAQASVRGNGVCEQTIPHRGPLEVLHRGMKGLTDKERAVIECVSLEGLTLREASTRMQVSYVNVRNHYYRGVNKLRRIAVEKAEIHRCKPGSGAGASERR